MDEHARVGRAFLPLQPKGGAHDANGGCFKVSVFGDDGGVLATQLEDGRAHVATLSEIAKDLHAHIIRTGEGDPVHFGALNQRLAERGARPGDVVKHTFRETGFLEAFSDQAGGPGGIGGGFHHQGIAGYQRGA